MVRSLNIDPMIPMPNGFRHILESKTVTGSDSLPGLSGDGKSLHAEVADTADPRQCSSRKFGKVCGLAGRR